MKEPLSSFIDTIHSLQSTGDAYFAKGLFPATRTNPLIGYRRKDSTIFFSAIICFTLQQIRTYCHPQDQAKIDNICRLVLSNYPDYQNKDGLNTYNFWKTKPSRHFPHGNLFHRHEHFRLPDDIDDTAFVYLTTHPSLDELQWLKHKLGLHANGSKQWIRNTWPEYRQLKAYSTWFGKTMYQEFDVCALSNLLYCILFYDLPLNQNDSDSFTYIRSCIETGRYKKSAFHCAHHYPRTPLLIYHVARLIGRFHPPALAGVETILERDIQELLQANPSKMDRVLLAIALLQLGAPTQPLAVETYTEKDFKNYGFFIAGLLTAYENPILYRLAPLPIFHMQWVCPAHCWTLLAEYQALWNLRNPTK